MAQQTPEPEPEIYDMDGPACPASPPRPVAAIDAWRGAVHYAIAHKDVPELHKLLPLAPRYGADGDPVTMYACGWLSGFTAGG